MIENTLILKVEDITETHLDTTCHVLEMLGELFNEENIE